MAKVKTINAVSAYNVLKQIKTKELPAEVVLAIWKNVKALKATATSYEDAIKDAKESLKSEDDDKMNKLLEELQKKEAKQSSGDYTFTRTDNEQRAEVIEYFDAANKKIQKFTKELDEKEIAVQITPIKEDDLVKAFATTDFNIGILELLDFLIAKDNTSGDANKPSSK